MMKVGLALGGGGARGFAHLGILKAIQELEVPIHCIAGTSIGAIIGGAFAAGIMDKAMEWTEQSNWKKLPKLFLDLHLSLKSIISGERIEKFLRQMMPISDFKDMPIPFGVVATDLLTGEEVVMTNGDIPSAIRASMSIPGIFCPVERDGCVLVDGGMINPIPISICRQLGAEKVIAVDLNFLNREEYVKNYNTLNVLSVIDETFRIVMNVAKRHALSNMAEFTLTPPVRNINIFDFHKAKQLVTIGYDYTIMQKEHILEFVNA